MPRPGLLRPLTGGRLLLRRGQQQEQLLQLQRRRRGELKDVHSASVGSGPAIVCHGKPLFLSRYALVCV